MLPRSNAAMVLVAAMAAACVTATPVPAVAPALDRARAEQIALQAYDLAVAVMAGSTVALASVFRDHALATLSTQAERLAERRMRIEERAVTRCVVHFDAFSLEVVVAIAAQRRLVTQNAAEPAWTQTARQWWLRLAFKAARWWVVDQRDLPPDAWFAAR